MTIVHDILKQMPGLGQPQRKFLATLFGTIRVLRRRVNFRNLSRYCNYSERTIAPAISGGLLSTVISTRYILGLRKDNPNVFNALIQSWLHF